MSQKPVKIIIDTDPGIDDAMAIHYAFAEAGLEVVGLTSIFGNVYVDQATRNALSLVEMAGADCPVAEGAASPLVQPLNSPSHHVHGPEGFGHLPAPAIERSADPRPAWQFISERCREMPGEIVLCPVGPLTNLARLLDYDPDIVNFVKRVVIMGGAAFCAGNVTPVAEANIWNDPHAADAVFAASWPVEMIGLDVTSQIKCDRGDFARLAEQAPARGRFLETAADFYIDFYQSVLGEAICLMHDPAALVAVLHPEFFTFEPVPLQVVTSGADIGRSCPDAGLDRPPVKIATKVDAAAVRDCFFSVTAKADQRAAARG